MITIVLTSYLEIGVASSHKHLCGLWLVCTIMHINIKFGGLQSKHCQHLWGAIERKTRKIYRKEITQVTKQWPTSSGIVSYFSSSWEIVLLGKFLGQVFETHLEENILVEVTNILEVCKYHRFLCDGRLFETKLILAENIFSQKSWMPLIAAIMVVIINIVQRSLGDVVVHIGPAGVGNSIVIINIVHKRQWVGTGHAGREKVHFSPKNGSTQEQTSCSCEYLIILILNNNITILTLPLRAVGRLSPASLIGPKKFFRVSSRSWRRQN